MRKQLATVILFLLSAGLVFSQNKNHHAEEKSIGQTSFIAEGGGPGIAFSANIDRRFAPGRLGWGGRIGIGFVSAWDEYYDPVNMTYVWGDQKSAITTPVQINYIFGKENSVHAMEVGAGITYVSRKLAIMNFDYYDKDRRSQVFGTFSFMYRRQPLNGGFSWRAGFTPLVAKSYIQPFAAVSIGYNF